MILKKKNIRKAAAFAKNPCQEQEDLTWGSVASIISTKLFYGFRAQTVVQK